MLMDVDQSIFSKNFDCLPSDIHHVPVYQTNDWNCVQDVSSVDFGDARVLVDPSFCRIDVMRPATAEMLG